MSKNSEDTSAKVDKKIYSSYNAWTAKNYECQYFINENLWSFHGKHHDGMSQIISSKVHLCFILQKIRLHENENEYSSRVHKSYTINNYIRKSW